MMLKRRFRFYTVIAGAKRYLQPYADGYTDRPFAGLFTQDDFDDWAEDSGLEYEEIGEDEAMRLLGAPMLPGLEV